MSASRNGYIGRAPADSSVIIARKTHEPTGVQTDFTFNSGYTPGYCDVYMNGVKLIDEKDFTATNGSTVGLTSAAQSGDIIELVAYKAFNLGVPVSDITGNLDITGYVSASSSITAGAGVYVTGVVTATSFYGDASNLSGIATGLSAAIGVSSEGTFVGAGNTIINFMSTNGAAWNITSVNGIATATVTPGVSLGLAIALGG